MARVERSEHFSSGLRVGKFKVSKVRADSGLKGHPEHHFSSFLQPYSAEGLVKMQVLIQYVTGKGQYWLHVGSVSLTLIFGFLCFSYYNYSKWTFIKEPCPSVWMLDESAFVQLSVSQSDPTYLWMVAEKNKLAYPLPKATYSRRYLQYLWPFYLTSSPPPPPLCSIKEPVIQNWKDSYFQTLVCHFLSQPAFQIKLYSLSQHLVSQIYWHVMHWAEWPWTQ